MSHFTEESTVREVICDPAFSGFGRLFFPVDRPISPDMTLRELSSSDVYLWYSEIRPETTVDILNTLWERASGGEQIFYPLSRADTGLFFLRGNPGEKFAVCNAAVIMQYTGYDACDPADAPTYACVGTNDGIASWRGMQQRLQHLEQLGIPTEFHVYPGLRHGFGLGIETAAEEWIKDAAAFWEKQV